MKGTIAKLDIRENKKFWVQARPAAGSGGAQPPRPFASIPKRCAIVRLAEKLRLAAAALVVVALIASPSLAITRGEFVTDLWRALGYADAPEKRLPPDVAVSHPHAKSIGYAARWGLIRADEAFSPDEEINRHQAVRLALQLMGWGYEVSLYDSLSSLPDLSGSGDSVFFLASEMEPPAPSGVLIDGSTPLSATARDGLINWVTSCKKFVRWNRVFSHEGVDLSLFRQGVARPGETNVPGVDAQIGAAACEPMFVAALCVRPAQADTRLAFSEPLGSPRIVPSTMHAGYGAIAAVNGGYFHASRPIGSMLINGTPAGKPIMGRGAFGWNNGNGTLIFGRGGARVGVRVGGRFAEITKFNVAPPAGEAALYTSDVTPVCVGAAIGSLVIAAKGGVVTEVRDASAASFWMPPESTVVIARDDARARLAGVAVGDKFETVSEWETQSFDACRDLIQGGPMLMMQGRFTAEDEGIAKDVAEKRHPRTIVGTDGERVIWAVVDGRSNIHSRGSTIEEAKWIAKSLGMTSALNLDGGGSSQMIWRGVLVNSPSDGKERPLPYTVLMMKRGAKFAWTPPAGDDQPEWRGWFAGDDGATDTYDPNGTTAAIETPTPTQFPAQTSPAPTDLPAQTPAQNSPAPVFVPGMKPSGATFPMPPGSPADADEKYMTVYTPEQETGAVDDEISALMEKYFAPKSEDAE